MRTASLAAILAPATPRAFGATKTWTDGAGTAVWSNSSNWSGGIPTSADIAAFPAVVPHNHSTITLSNGEAAAAISFDNDYILSGGNLTLGSSSGILVDSGDVAEIAPPIGGSSGLTKVGAGKLVLGSASVFTGGVTINAGTLAVSADDQLGNSANDVAINGATLATTGNFSSARTFTPGASGGNIDTATGTLTLNSALPASSNVWTFSGGGTLVLTAPSARTGATTIDNTTRITDPAQLGDGTGSLTVSGGTLDLSNTAVTTAVELDSGAIRGEGTSSYTGEIVLPPNAKSSLASGSSPSDLLVIGDGSSAGLSSFDTTPNIAIAGNGRVLLAAPNGNYTGSWSIDSGTLTVGDGSALGDGTAAVMVYGGMLESDNAAISQPVSLADGTTLKGAGDAMFDGTVTVPPSGNVTFAADAGDELEIGNPNVASYVSLDGGSSAGTTITVAGPGTISLHQQINTLVQWILTGGTLDVGSDDRLGSPNLGYNGVTLSGGTLLYSQTGNVLRTIAANAGAIDLENHANITLNQISIANGADLHLTGNGILRLFDQTYGASGTIDVDGGTLFLLQAAGTAASAPLNVNVNSPGARFGTNVTNYLHSLTIADGASAQLTVPGIILGTSNLSITGSGNLDVYNDALILKSAGAAGVGTWNGTAYTGLSGYVASGRNGGSWNGPGIISSLASTGGSNLYTLGVARAGDVAGISGTQTATWDGQTVTADDALVMYTYGGDANLDGKINIDDYGRIDGNVGQSGSVFGWYNGDFNYDGKINIDDYGIIDGNIGEQGAPIPTASMTSSVTAVPEPASLAMLLTAGLWTRRRHLRHFPNTSRGL